MAIVRWWHHFNIIIFLLKPISRDLRWRKLSWLIYSYRVQLQCIVNALRNSAGVHARAPAILRLVTGAARDRIPPAGRRIAIFQSHTHGQSGKYRQLQHLGKPFALVNKTSRNTFLTSVLIGKTPLKPLYLKYTQYSQSNTIPDARAQFRDSTRIKWHCYSAQGRLWIYARWSLEIENNTLQTGA